MTDSAALPGVLAEIEEVAGREAALRLALEFGGESVYVPRPEHLGAGHPVSLAIGEAAARNICERFAGDCLHVPMARRKLVGFLVAQHLTTAQIAARLGMSTGAVRRYRRECS